MKNRIPLSASKSKIPSSPFSSNSRINVKLVEEAFHGSGFDRILVLSAESI
jgi:hypothetical protein